MALEAKLSSAPDVHLDHEKKLNPDMVLINTCTVTEQADKQALQLVRKLRRKHPASQIVMTGCYAELKKNDLQQIPDINAVVDFKEQHDLLHTLGWTAAQSLPQHRLVSTTRTRANLKIQDGCQAYCSYCVLPYVRGKSRSVPLELIVKQADAFVSHGHQEVVITGTHIAGYGRDFAERKRLSDLLYAIFQAHPQLSIRVSSLEPVGLTPDFIKAVQNIPSVRPHFHVPLQSGCDAILKSMNRKYQTKHYQARIDQLHNTREAVNIGTDVIVGYPGETADQFEETCEFIKKMPISYLHVFPYSPRPNTKSATLKETVSPVEKKQRVKTLIGMGLKKKKAFYNRFMDQVRPVLIEKKKSSQDWLKGVSPEYLNVHVQGHDRLMTKEVDVKLTRVCHDAQGDMHFEGRVV